MYICFGSVRNGRLLARQQTMRNVQEIGKVPKGSRCTNRWGRKKQKTSKSSQRNLRYSPKLRFVYLWKMET